MSSKVITVFGSSRPRADEPDYEEARLLGRALAERRGFVVCSGGYVGVMEAVFARSEGRRRPHNCGDCTIFPEQVERMGGRGSWHGNLAGALV